MSLSEHLEYWHLIVNSYSKTMPVSRLPIRNEQVVPQGHVRIHYPKWSFKKIEQVIAKELILPAGTTQFIIQKRLLNLCIPLRILFTRNDITEWDELRTLWSSSIRYYPESVYMFDGDQI